MTWDSAKTQKSSLPPPPLHTHILPFLWRCQGRKKPAAAACTFPHFWAPKIGGEIKKKRRIGATFLMTAISRVWERKVREGRLLFHGGCIFLLLFLVFFLGWISSQAEKWILTSKRSSLCSFWVQKYHFYLGEGKKTLLREKGVFVSNRKSHFVSGAFELIFFIKYLFSSIEVIAGVRLLALFPQMVPLVRAQGKLLHEIQTPFSNKN